MARTQPGTDPWGESLNADLDSIEAQAVAAQTTADAANAAAAAAATAAGTKANDNAVVKLTGDQTVAGVKTFSSSPLVPDPTTDAQAAHKKYVDDKTAGIPSDSTVVKLTGDQTVDGVKTFTSSPIVPAPTTSEQAARKADVDLKANDSAVVKTTGAQTISGIKTFSSAVVLPVPTQASHAVRKDMLDAQKLASGVTFDPSTTGMDATTVQAAVEELMAEKTSAETHTALATRVTALEGSSVPEAKRFRLTADVALNASSVGFQDVTGAVFSAFPANSEWDFQIELSVAGDVTGDIKVQFTGPAGGDIQYIITGPNAGNAADGGTQKSVVRTGFGQPSGGFGTLAAAPQPLVITGTIIIGATAGSVQLQAAQNTADVAAPSIKSMSKGTAVRAA